MADCCGYLKTLFQLQSLYSIEREQDVVMNGEHARIWKQAVLAYFNALFSHSLPSVTQTTKTSVSMIVIRPKFNRESPIYGLLHYTYLIGGKMLETCIRMVGALFPIFLRLITYTEFNLKQYCTCGKV
jgi:hypothetical protein